MAEPRYATFLPPPGADFRFLMNSIERGRARTASAGVKRVLVDLLALQDEPQEIESLLLGHHVGVHLSGLDRIAVLLSREIAFSETVAQRLGANMRVFDSRVAAIAWLESAETSVTGF
ncbi:MAG TPA: hypothetical protein VIE63_17720 [Ramlibacter sp.]|jgi:hypothetical protein